MDIILYNIIIGLGMLIFGYLLGSIQFGIIITKARTGQDPRNFGSGNSGGTNVGRVLGKKWGVITILLDMLKTMIALLGAFFFIKLFLNQYFIDTFGQALFTDGVLFYYLAPLGASLGHCFPLYYGFKGGKTVSVFAGFAIITSWFEFLIGLFTYFITKKKSGFVSVASIVMGASTALIAWGLFGLTFVMPEGFQHIFMWGNGYFVLAGWEHASVTTIISILLIIRHIPNIKRLVAHEEIKPATSENGQ